MAGELTANIVVPRDPVLSVVIPTYNERESLLRRAVESVLGQTYGDLELILVDDGSTDGTPDVLAAYAAADRRFRPLRRERDSAFRSVPQAFNVGLAAARGRWWHHEAADNWHEPDWAERVMRHIRGRESELLGAHTDFAVHHYDGAVEHVRVEQRWSPALSYLENYHQQEALGGMVFRMDLARAAGLWDWRLPRKHTRDWTLRVMRLALANRLALAYLPRELWHFDYHEPDQLKRNASAKYRILVDLKQGIDIRHNLGVCAGSEDGRYALLDATRAFFTEDRWRPEREAGPTADRLARIRAICDAEASETWVQPAAGEGRPAAAAAEILPLWEDERGDET